MHIDSKEFLVEPSSSFHLDACATRIDELSVRANRASLKKHLASSVNEIQRWQELLFAERQQSLLVILQGMDTSGKDSAIKHVCTGVNPQGLRVYGFGVPTTTEFEQSFLRRFWDVFPSSGFIHVFNRSYYEELTVVRVHPELLAKRNFSIADVDAKFWLGRINDITSLEKHLSNNGTKILKFFLHISKDQQRLRLQKRLNDPTKFWKFDPSDLKEREHWDEYQDFYSDAIRDTANEIAPWYVVPADHKPLARAVIADAMAVTLASMSPNIPQVTHSQAEAVAMFNKL